jgi:unsaturated rhamnogalacturonyl hydrolase
MTPSRNVVLSFALIGLTFSAQAQSLPKGRSDPSFSQPSLAPGVDYVVPTEAEIRATLDRVFAYITRSTAYSIIDTKTNQPITDFTNPIKTADIDNRAGQFNNWDYPVGVVLAGLIQLSDVTGDPRYTAYTLKNFDFLFDHEAYFRKQSAQFGPQSHGFRRLLEFGALDDCGAIGAALVKAYAKKQDPRYKATIDRVAGYIAKTQMRLPDGTLARPRPQPVALWADDAYMSIPFLTQMGKLIGDRVWFDDAVRQVVGFTKHLQDPRTGLYDHAWYENTASYDPHFFWGRGAGWVLMATAELLSELPENHPGRAQVLEIFRNSARAATEYQGSTGMWHQLLDKTDSYLESSATAMFTFAIARGVNRGWLTPVYAPVAQTGWQALATRVRPDGRVSDICVSTTAAYDSLYYYNRPTDLDAMQGYGPVLMAGAEVITMLRNFDIEHTLNTFHYRTKKK